MLHVKHSLVRGSGDMSLGKILESRFSENASAGYPHLRKINEYVLR